MTKKQQEAKRKYAREWWRKNKSAEAKKTKKEIEHPKNSTMDSIAAAYTVLYYYAGDDKNIQNDLNKLLSSIVIINQNKTT